MTFDLIAAAETGTGNFVVGLLLGVCIGLLVGPAFRSWLIFREWTDASREVKLADRLLTKLEADAEEDADPDRASDEPETPSRTKPPAPAWPTSR
jgi:hypothetical protein